MSTTTTTDSSSAASYSRTVGTTERSWCKAVPGGTGITVLALLLKKPLDFTLLEKSLHKLQTTYPILRANLIHFDNQTFSFSVPPTSNLRLKTITPTTTAKILTGPDQISPLQKILEHEMNINPWAASESSFTPQTQWEVFHATAYEYGEESSRRWVVVLKIHTSVCDRVAAVAILRELLAIASEEVEVSRGGETEVRSDGVIHSSIEEYVPSNKSNKPFWARGMDMLGYSLNSFRLSNLGFVDSKSSRFSQVARLEMSRDETSALLKGSKKRGIELCAVLAAAGLMAARLCKGVREGEWDKYAVATLVNCRPFLNPPLTPQDIGFYHSAVLNTHDTNGRDHLWELSSRTYSAFNAAKTSNKHFTDMSDLNFLMCRAIENPGLTPSSSMRTSCVSVFEDPVIEETHDGSTYERIGVEDYMGCSSVHGVGPSVALFETVRDGKMDCLCVYPAPLHSREQMQGFVDHMKRVLVDAATTDS